MASLITLTPAPLPLSASEIRQQSRIDDTGEDALIEEYIAAASRLAEEASGRPVGETVYQLRLNRFPDQGEPILLPRPRTITVDSISYLDASGESQSLTAPSRQDDLFSEPARIYPAVGSSWPMTQSGAFNAVTITFTAGSQIVDPLVLQAIRLAVGDWFEHRENSVEKTVSRLPLGFDRLLNGVRFRSRELQRFLHTH
ncbi:head-tail connector protein [Planctomicrobium sp. SH527]|uniref:head-tail connector protein n=1 Tax=Planctomicrobium sp. SH527 TaxID=3448123 RepID=UPI003F5C3B0A